MRPLFPHELEPYDELPAFGHRIVAEAAQDMSDQSHWIIEFTDGSTERVRARDLIWTDC